MHAKTYLFGEIPKGFDPYDSCLGLVTEDGKEYWPDGCYADLKSGWINRKYKLSD